MRTYSIKNKCNYVAEINYNGKQSAINVCHSQVQYTAVQFKVQQAAILPRNAFAQTRPTRTLSTQGVEAARTLACF